LIFIYLLASRAELLTALITIPVYILLKFKIKSIKRIIGLASILALVVFFVLIPILKSNPRFSYYFNEKSKGDLSSKVLEESRLTIWKSSLILISNNFVFGVGTGDIQDELNKEYNLIPGNNLAVQNNLNAHNQYLEIQLENGIIGLLLFLSIFGMMIYIAIKNRNTLYLIFVISVFISFMFETMLNRLGGVAFFSLFAFLLLNLKPAKKPDESISV
jgi:O-antigen ligase